MKTEELRIDVIADVEGLSGLRAQWNGLLQDSSSDCPFLTWEWLYTWWIHLAGTRRLHVLAVYAGSELIGLAPVAVTHAGLPWLSKLEFLGTGFAGSDYLDLIARRGCEREVGRAFAEALRSRKLALRLDHLPPSSTASAMSGELADGGWSAARAGNGVCPYATLAGRSWDEYLKTLAASHQMKVRRYTNTLSKKFDVRFEAATTDASRREALAALVGFHHVRWGQRGGSTAFQSATLRAFHEDATRRALESGWLRLHVLRLDGTPAAVTYCFGYNRRFYLYQHGFNQQFRQFSVGLVALGLTIRRAIEEGAIEFDMLYGTEPYKGLWAREQRGLERIDLYPADVTGRFQQRTVAANQAMRLFAKRLLTRNVCNPDIHSAGAAS